MSDSVQNLIAEPDTSNVHVIRSGIYFLVAGRLIIT